MTGTKLANYEVTVHLGSMGMGDVYQAAEPTQRFLCFLNVAQTIRTNDIPLPVRKKGTTQRNIHKRRLYRWLTQ